MADSIFNGKKAVKKLLTIANISQREFSINNGLPDNAISIRCGRGYYDKPGNLARLVHDLGLVLDVQIIAKVKDQEGNVLFDVPINQDFMDEE